MKTTLVIGAAALCAAAAALPVGAQPPQQQQPEPLHIYVHYTETSPKTFDTAVKVGLLLMQQGFDIVDVRPVEAEMRRTTIRYFYPDLRDDAYRLKDRVEHLLQAQGVAHEPVRVQDFTRYKLKTPPNSCELWFQTQ
ncbi:MAG TPA: hypothetical protein VGD08_02675 [Stellaceae bacterium]|jgi:hypothetical protein